MSERRSQTRLDLTATETQSLIEWGEFVMEVQGELDEGEEALYKKLLSARFDAVAKSENA